MKIYKDPPVISFYIHELEEVDSTNTYLESRSSETNLPEGTVIWAQHQFRGRGQLDHSWTSEPGKNLTCSILFKPDFLSPDRQFLLNKAIALGVLDFVREILHEVPRSVATLPDTAIKWPNDIYIGNRKAGGILIAHRIMGKRISQTIAGIGININQEVFSPEIPNPVSFIHYTSQKLDLRQCLNQLCACLDRRYTGLRHTGVLSDEEYTGRLLGYERLCRFTANGQSFMGTICGVDDLGRLIIQHPDGTRTAYAHREAELMEIISGGSGFSKDGKI